MRVALVTGVSSGIGRAVAARLAREGFRTFGTARDGNAPENVALIRMDVRDGESVRSGVASVLDRTGRIDVLVNNAGTSLVGAVEETSLEEARALFEVNFFGALRVTQAVLPGMRARGDGRIVNVTSVLAFLPAPFMSFYAASKHALEGWSESLDHEVRPFGVRVVAIEPGFMRTELGHKSARAERSLPDYRRDRDRVQAAVSAAIERGAAPETVARLVLDAVTASSPRLRRPAGREARLLRALRTAAPSALVDSGLRRTFGLGGAS